MNRFGEWPAWVSVFTLAGVPGCSKPYQPPIVPAGGVVVQADGKPLKFTRVGFYPVTQVKQFVDQYQGPPYGLTDEKGRFSATVPNESGVPAGRYKVTISPDGPERASFPKRYLDMMTTPLEVTIPPEGTTDLHLQIEGK